MYVCVSGISEMQSEVYLIDLCHQWNIWYNLYAISDISDMPLPSTPPALPKFSQVSHDFHMCEGKIIKNLCKAKKIPKY